ncbi:hypothetical protein BJD66_gp36 [Gordonia phage Emalyn]|uniref:Uncharacterized protein n=1 Tax=Gordonia phage Emalyn TaxID=1821552 RepID=A0A142KBX2_9CAUD|nr:hypothetical protein BJD66_gp36 [Gordonia phage Emalyn]AMS03605.1 hypothetical protein SEA_EMALYN_36 [Gordonia phage Emalyn]UMO76160.1 hypothetical protein SEA_AMOK_37 [Gordonia phage Amok]
MKGEDWVILLGWLLILFFIVYMIAQVLRVIV